MSSLEEVVSEAFGDSVEITGEPEAEAPQGASEDGTPEQAAPPRDDKGRFAPAAQEDPDVNRYLDRFGGDVDKALRAAVEADSMIGRQGQQMGDLQRQLTEIQQAVTPQQQPGVNINQETVDWFDQQIEQNPYGAAEWARGNDPSGVLWNRAMDSWFDENPRQASAYERQLEMGQFAQAFQQQQQPLQEMKLQNEFVAAWSSLRQEIPDLDEQSEAILKAAQEAPEMLPVLQSGTPEAQMRLIRNLYKLAKFEQANQVAGQAPQAQGTPSPNSFVASGSQYAEPETKTEGELWAEENLDPQLERYYGTRGF